jgi:hypothetical protein
MTAASILAQASPGPWRYEAGGGHAYNSLRAADSVQTNGWPERRNGFSNASYSDRLCENLGDVNLPGPAANAAIMAHARDMAKTLLAIANDSNESNTADIVLLARACLRRLEERYAKD